MTLVVPYDGGKLSDAAVLRAAQFQEVLDEAVKAVTVIPRGNAEYARKKGWLDTNESFDKEQIVERLEENIAEIDPSVDFTPILVDRFAQRGTVSNAIRKFARNHDAGFVIVGSENAGRIVSGLTVGSAVVADTAYDTIIISAIRTSQVDKLEDAVPTTDVLD
jgi:nucleotide-binding universal stress UspA family protein